jgi:voltage-gated potassium channel
VTEPRTLTGAITTRVTLVRSRFAGWQYAQLAMLFPVFLLALPFIEHPLLVKAVLTLLLLNIMLVADSALPGARFLLPAGWALWTLATLGVLVEDFHIHDEVANACKFVGMVAHMLLIAMCGASIMSVVFRAVRVTLDGIFASVVTYQLIGLLFAQIYTMLELANPGSLHLPDSVPTSGALVRLEMIYFSFVTLATLGYGDIVPDTSFARSVTVIEAVVGQFYVAVVVAVLVSAFVAQRLTELADKDRG